jgi:hypothetical protein
MPKQNTKLESEGAEFLVLGHLLINGIFGYKAYVNFPGYDLVAVNPDTNKIARIQVKSRWATNYDKSFPISNFNSDFVVHVALNRGYRFGKRGKGDLDGIKLPDIYVFPTHLVKEAKYENSKWGKIKMVSIPDYLSYKENWLLIRTFLND